MAAARKSGPSASAKKVAPVVKQPRLSRAEAEARLLNATIKLVFSHAPADITVHMIAKEAGVHHDYIARYFTSREELLIQTTEIPLSGVRAETVATQGKNIRSSISASSPTFQLARLRTQLISYLLACGVPPQRFAAAQQLLIEDAMGVFVNPALSTRSKRNFALLGILLMQSMHVMGEVNGMTQQDKDDLTAFLLDLANITTSVQSSLGWDKAAPKKSK
jgi:AcrR family transcriptional regulator